MQKNKEQISIICSMERYGIGQALKVSSNKTQSIQQIWMESRKGLDWIRYGCAKLILSQEEWKWTKYLRESYKHRLLPFLFIMQEDQKDLEGQT